MSINKSTLLKFDKKINPSKMDIRRYLRGLKVLKRNLKKK